MAANACVPPVCVAAAPSTTEKSPRKKYKSILYRLGITETVLGSVSCILCIMSIILQYNFWHRYKDELDSLFTFIASGLWCGVFVVASGGVGISAQKYPSVCVYNASMALSIIAAFFAGTQTIISGMAIPFSYSYIRICHIVLTILGFTCLVICIVHSAYCCAGTCCRKKASELPVAYSAVNPQQYYVQLMSGQYMLVQNHPNKTSPPQASVMMPHAMPMPLGTANTNQGTPAPSAPMPTQPVYPILQGHSGMIPVPQSTVAPVALSPVLSGPQPPQVENPHLK